MSTTPNAPTQRLLVVDDEPDLRTLYELTLVREGYDVECAESAEEAWALLQQREFQVIITDMRLPGGSGLSLLQQLEGAGRREKAIVITAYGSAENAVEALKAGAYDYLTKPVDLRQFRAVVASALGRASELPGPARDGPQRRERAVAAAAKPAPDTAASAPALQRLVGESDAMRQVRGMVEKVARSMAPVLVRGESGTGKELVARAIHDASPRAAMPFVAVNCGAIPENLLEAEFFGYRKGAFTGAADDREGFFQAAQGGTLFLDEIGDLPLSMQSKLLRAIQERAVRPVGAVAEVPANVRVLSATHKDLAEEVHGGRFRQDLYYRLNVIQIMIPPLRERMQDLHAICEAVLQRISREAGVQPTPQMTAGALDELSRQAFPGNVRELENLLHRVLALSGGERIEREDLGLPADGGDGVAARSRAGHASAPAGASAAIRPPQESPVAAALPHDRVQLPSDLVAYLDTVERDVLERALERHRFNRTAAGASLGLSLRQMRYRMARLGVLSDDAERGESA